MLSKKLLSALLCIVMVLALHVAHAQDRTVTGKVSDSKDGTPVSGASVQVKGTRVGTSTKADGTFSLSVSSSATTLVITSIGYETLEVSIEGKNFVEISFVSSLGTNLNEVVVTGYGTARKKDLTGSISSVKAKDFNKGVVTSPDQLIQGKVSGLQIINNSGQPGVAATIRIRGTSSIRSGNNPLIVVDGIPLSGRTPRPGNSLNNIGASPASNPLVFVNPSDIASIDVLKDASATAIYGSRGANGVIIITTKKPSSGQPTIDVNYTIGTGSIMKKLDVLSGDQYRQALTQYGLTTGDYGDNVNAFDQIIRKTLTHNISVSASGGNENARYRFSASALKDEGIIKQSDLTKYTVGFMGSFKFLDSKKLGLDVMLSTAQVNESVVPITNDAGFEGNLVAQALQWNPTHALIKPDGTYWIQPQFGASSINPLWFLKMYDDQVKSSFILASISPSYKFTNDLEYRMLYSLYQGDGRRYAMVGRQLLNIDRYKDRGLAYIGQGNERTQQFTHTLSYNKQLNSNLNLNAVIGYEYIKFQYTSSGEVAQDFEDIGIKYYDMIAYGSQSSRSVYNYRDPSNELQSFFARAAFNVKNKYLLTATLRADGSTKFGKDNRYGYFPSIGAAWNISNEDFMNSVNFVSNLKLRLGWGQTGNQEFPSGAAQTRFGVSGIGSLSQLNVANPALKWETSSTANVGLDFGILKSRVNFVIDYFSKKTKDVLFERDFPQPGASSAKQWINSPVTITNSGVEIGINADIIAKGDLGWTFGITSAFLKNNLEGLVGTYNTGALHGQGSTGAYVQKLASGYPINTYYLRIFQGIDKTTGQAIYEQDGDVSFFVNKSPNPKFLLGLSTNVQYKKWSLTANMNGAYGHYLYNNTAQSVVPITNLGTRNVAASLINTSVVENTSNPITSSTRFLEKGNYLKMSNLTISYNLGGFAKFIRSSTISLTGQNLFVLTDFTGFDPEVNVDKNIGGIPSLGIEYIPYPTARKFQLSLGLGF
ncbi:MAG TPA: SusC/RagA family TonB-linked outer membrane protein [Chitinophagaceae bacterium]|nr:SusC/RagA family TonB-linked outer membrane protein [Chitinophagaceae bacterium]